MRIVTLFLLRHGQKSGDSNTAFGLEQLAATNDAHLAGVTIDWIYCSDMKRTMQAAKHILAHRNNPEDSGNIIEHPAFFVGFLSNPEHLEESVRIDKLLGEHGGTRDWQENWKEAPSITEGIVTAMKEMAELATDGDTVLVCNHSPLCGLAALDDMAPIGLADVVKYTMEDDGSGWKIASSELLRCPLKVPTAT